jgi:hypothetical protein
MPPVPFKVPAWADPNNASVLDSPLQKAARTLGGMFGAADPQAQVMAIATPIETPVGWKGVIPDTVSDIGKYQGGHTPPMKGSGAPIHDLTDGIYPHDVYGPEGPRIYGQGTAFDMGGRGGNMDRSLFAQFRALRGKPDAMVKIYRAVPKDAPVTHIQHGDWVSPSRAYAVGHGESSLRGNYKILEGEVPAKTLFTNGDSPYEFGIDLSVLPEKKP